MTDPNRTYIRGKSMGGSGAISMAFHHPDVFATVYSDVPIVAYTSRTGCDGKSNLHRLNGLCRRICDETVMSSDGIPVMERMNSERIVLESPKELPFLVLCNGRTDGSIPWVEEMTPDRHDRKTYERLYPGARPPTGIVRGKKLLQPLY